MVDESNRAYNPTRGKSWAHLRVKLTERDKKKIFYSELKNPTPALVDEDLSKEYDREGKQTSKSIKIKNNPSKEALNNAQRIVDEILAPIVRKLRTYDDKTTDSTSESIRCIKLSVVRGVHDKEYNAKINHYDKSFYNTGLEHVRGDALVIKVQRYHDSSPLGCARPQIVFFYELLKHLYNEDVKFDEVICGNIGTIGIPAFYKIIYQSPTGEQRKLITKTYTDKRPPVHRKAELVENGYKLEANYLRRFKFKISTAKIKGNKTTTKHKTKKSKTKKQRRGRKLK